MSVKFLVPIVCIFSFLFSSCSNKSGKSSEEQISVSPGSESESDSTVSDSLWNSVTGNVTMKQIATFPNNVILTGLADHRLVSIYKSRQAAAAPSSVSKYYSYSEDAGDESEEHFMPGIDILYGYNLLNIAHYDMKTEKGNFLFNHPVLVKTLYYPCFIQDSLDKKPINRDYYLVSVYDEDTNKDSLINKKDLRRLYHFDASSTIRKQLIPSDYSVMHSQYDSKNDVMYVFARHDENKNGTHDRTEPMHIFWFSLKMPDVAKLLY